MKVLSAVFLFFVLIGSNLQAFDQPSEDQPGEDQAVKESNKDKNKVQPEGATISGFRDATGEREVEKKFIAVPDPKLAEEHLRILTSAPHVAGTPEDKKTAEYVAQKFREAGLKSEIVEYKIWMNYPAEISVAVTAPPNVHMNGPRRESVAKGADPYQDDPRVITPFNG